jgi:hypothetical protein
LWEKIPEVKEKRGLVKIGKFGEKHGSIVKSQKSVQEDLKIKVSFDLLLCFKANK